MKIELIDKWKDDVNGTDDRYCELRLYSAEACCVKYIKEEGYIYVLECYDGNEVYSYTGGSDFPLRKLTKEEEMEVISFAERVLLKVE